MNINSIKTLAEAALAKLAHGKRYALSDVYKRTQQARQQYPQDSVIQAFGHVIERVAQKSGEQMISQGDLDNIYQQVVGLNVSGTRFRDALGDLLITKQPNISTSNDNFIAERRATGDMVSYDIDNELKNDLDGVFTSSNQLYDPQLAAKAKNKVIMELNSIGFPKNRVRLAGGNAEFLIFSADLDTNRGVVRVLIPASASGAQLPTVFSVNDKFVKLTADNIDKYITTQANRYSVMEKQSDIGSVDVPTVPVPEPLKGIANFEESVVEASTNYPATSVRLAKKMVISELSGMGFKGSQVRVSEPTGDGFICEATINTPKGKVNIEIPIEMKNNTPLMPSVFAKDDFVADFTAPNLMSLVAKEANIQTPAVYRDSPLMTFNIEQLKEVIYRSAMKGDLDTCDEVLEIISERFGPEIYATAVSDYQRVLNSKNETNEILRQAYEDSDQFVKTPNSLYPIHKKLLRPAHELIRDEDGEYHLKNVYYGRQAQKSSEGVLFNTAKILVGD